MKLIITYIIVFILLLLGDNILINYIISLFQNHDIALIIQIILWLITIGPIIALTMILGGLIIIIIEK